MAMFGEAFTEVACESAFWSMEFDADWSWPPPLDWQHEPPELCDWLFDCDEVFEFDADELADEPDDWSTLPLLPTAMFGDTFSETALEPADCVIEFVALWL
jgi:hypothetical protein